MLTDDRSHAQGLLTGWVDDGPSPVSGLHRFRRRLDGSQRPVAPVGTRKVTYTSGSTSNPKGVCLSGDALEAIAAAVADATRVLPIARHLCVLPLATLLENVAGLYAPLLRGATCVLPPSRVTGMSYRGLDVARLLATLDAQRPQSLILVPELLQVLVTAVEQGWTWPDSLRFVAVGGAKVAQSLLDAPTRRAFPSYEGYGLSECASVVCLNTPAARRAGTVGRPLPHVRIRIDEARQVHVAGNADAGLPRRPHPGWAANRQRRGRDRRHRVIRRRRLPQLQGRAAHRFITSLGRNVSPEWVECEVAQRPESPGWLHGEARPFVVLLVGATAQAACSDAAVERPSDEVNASGFPTMPAYAAGCGRRVLLVLRTGSRRPTAACGAATILHARSASLLDSLYQAELAS